MKRENLEHTKNKISGKKERWAFRIDWWSDNAVKRSGFLLCNYAIRKNHWIELGNDRANTLLLYKRKPENKEESGNRNKRFT